MDNNIHEELLTNPGIAAAHAALIKHYEWFGHVVPVDRFQSIKTEGLRVGLPETAKPLAEAIDKFGDDGKKIVCLSPLPRRTPLLLNMDGKSAFKVALPNTALPKRIGVDWSFGGMRELTLELRAQNPRMPVHEIYMRVVSTSEVVASYDAIDAATLRVCPRENPNGHPSQWPLLRETDLKDIEIFKPDLVGNISV